MSDLNVRKETDPRRDTLTGYTTDVLDVLDVHRCLVAISRKHLKQQVSTVREPLTRRQWTDRRRSILLDFGAAEIEAIGRIRLGVTVAHIGADALVEARARAIARWASR